MDEGMDVVMMDDEWMYEWIGGAMDGGMDGGKEGNRKSRRSVSGIRESDSTFLRYAVMTKNHCRRKTAAVHVFLFFPFFFNSVPHGQLPAAAPSLSYKWRWSTEGGFSV